MLTVGHSTLEDCYLLGKTMCQKDRDEVYASTGETNMGLVLWRSKEASSKCLTFRWDNHPLMMFGVAPMDHFGRIWALAGDTTPIKPFLRDSYNYWLKCLGEGFTNIGNIMDIRQCCHKRWLTSLGFHFSDQIILSELGYPFIAFMRKVGE